MVGAQNTHGRSKRPQIVWPCQDFRLFVKLEYQNEYSIDLWQEQEFSSKNTSEYAWDRDGELMNSAKK